PTRGQRVGRTGRRAPGRRPRSSADRRTDRRTAFPASRRDRERGHRGGPRPRDTRDAPPGHRLGRATWPAGHLDDVGPSDPGGRVPRAHRTGAAMIAPPLVTPPTHDGVLEPDEAPRAAAPVLRRVRAQAL